MSPRARDVFNAEDYAATANENDSLTYGDKKLGEHEFGSAYEGVDTGYGRSSTSGDRRSAGM
jgi:hypothetical protein